MLQRVRQMQWLVAALLVLGLSAAAAATLFLPEVRKPATNRAAPPIPFEAEIAMVLKVVDLAAEAVDEQLHVLRGRPKVPKEYQMYFHHAERIPRP